jgi:Ca2+/H+ antiporter, TMEM165/GDT1 family
LFHAESSVIAVFLAEIGGKTQVATIMLAARFDNLAAVVLGTTVGMLIADVPASGNRVPLKAIRFVAAGLFDALGVWTCSPAEARVKSSTRPSK